MRSSNVWQTAGRCPQGEMPEHVISGTHNEDVDGSKTVRFGRKVCQTENSNLLRLNVSTLQ